MNLPATVVTLDYDTRMTSSEFLYCLHLNQKIFHDFSVEGGYFRLSESCVSKIILPKFASWIMSRGFYFNLVEFVYGEFEEPFLLACFFVNAV